MLLAGLIFRINPDLVPFFVIFSGVNALFPPVVVAIRATNGKMRELFWVLFCLLATIPIFPMAAYLFGSRFPSNLTFCIVASTFAGLAAGCLLVHFGKIHPKAL